MANAPKKVPEAYKATTHASHTPSTCVVLFSGGQDSTTCLFAAKNNFERVIALSFNYGQKHSVELEQAKKIAEVANIFKHEILDITGLLRGSAQTEHNLDGNAAHAQNSALPATFTPGRNALFLTLAASYAYTHGIFDIMTGVCETDYSGYPDCRQEFISSQERTLRLALDCQALKIHTPLMLLDKSEIWKMAVDLSCFNVVRDMSFTDYNGNLTKNVWGMGTLNNDASMLRAKGFVKAFEKKWIKPQQVIEGIEEDFRPGWTAEAAIEEVERTITFWGHVKECSHKNYDNHQTMMYLQHRMEGHCVEDSLEHADAQAMPKGIHIFNMKSDFGGPEIHNALDKLL